MTIEPNKIIMNLTEKKEQLIKQSAELEKIKKEAHDGILAINAKLRKPETVIGNAEELFQEEEKVTTAE